MSGTAELNMLLIDETSLAYKIKLLASICKSVYLPTHARVHMWLFMLITFSIFYVQSIDYIP